MLEKQDWIRYAPEIMKEYQQLHDEGRDVAPYRASCEALAAMPWSPACETMADALYAQMSQAPMRQDYPYAEPSAYEEILAVLPEEKTAPFTAGVEALRDKITGAWIGRIAGCLLGKPFEMLRSQLIHEILKESNNFPMSRYADSREFSAEFAKRADEDPHAPWKKCWVNLIGDAAPVDDDTNYTVFAMKLVDTYGREFRANDVLEGWLSWIPMLATCTAERVAYRNAAGGLTAPETASYRNPYREWIGAQIRGDFFGFINPGQPRKAAEMAWRDASISHVKNGIYGEMFVAAMIAQAAVTDDLCEIVETGLNEIPANCRLTADVKKVLSWYREGKTWEYVLEQIYAQYDENVQHDWCHTNSNAMIVTAALLYGNGDFGKSICLAVQSAFDTDCNGATVGSIVGIRNGGSGVPAYWGESFHHALRTSLDGYQLVTVEQLVEKTLKLM